MNLERQLHIFGYLIWSDFNTRLSCVIAFSKIYVKLLIHREYFKERKCGRMVFMHEWVFWHKNNECVRDRSLFIVWRERRGGGGRAGRRIFVPTTEHLRDSPPKGYSVVYPPTLVVEDFMIPLLLSQPPQKASVTICKEVTSILILTFHEPWTATSHIWSSDMKWIVCEGLLFSSKSLKTKSLSLSSSSLWNSSSYSSSPVPLHSHLWHHTIRLCSQTLWSYSMSYFVKLPTSQSVFFQVEVKFLTLTFRSVSPSWPL